MKKNKKNEQEECGCGCKDQSHGGESCGCGHDHNEEGCCSQESGEHSCCQGGKECSCQEELSETEALSKEISKWQEQFAKAMATAAHHENLSKVYKNEYDKNIKYRSQALVEKLLPVLDSFQMAFSMKATNKETENYRLGFEFTSKLLKESLESEGVREITPKVNDKFDPYLNSAVEVVETLDPELEGKIAAVLLNGYQIKDRIIRPANVKIYGIKKEEVQEQKEEAQA